MNLFKKTFLVVLALSAISTTSFLCAETNDTLKTPVSQSHIDRAKAKTEIMAKELSLTPEQQELVAGAIARRDFDNSIKTRGLTTPEEKSVVYRATYLEFVATLKTKLPSSIVNKIGTWEAEYKERIKNQSK